MKLPPLVACLLLLVSAGWFGLDGGEAFVETKIDVHRFRVIERESGNVNYYHVIEQPEGAILHAAYRPKLDSVILGMEMPEKLRSQVKRLQWRWRVQAFPAHGNDCSGKGVGDSAASVFVTFKRGQQNHPPLFRYSRSHAQEKPELSTAIEAAR